MSKFTIYLAYLLLAIAAAGAFGAIHDQISYTVSPEYFTRFKFIQFDLTGSSAPERLRAAQVGFLGSWWMGWPLGLLAGLGGFMHRTPREMRNALLWSVPVISLFTLAVALCGLGYGYLQTAAPDPARYRDWYIPQGVSGLRAFLCVGHMHNAAYLGGAASVPLAWLFHAAYRWRTERAGRSSIEQS